MMKKMTKTWLLAGLAVLVVLTVFPVLVIALTPEGSVPREWVVNFRQTMLTLCGLAAFVGVIVATARPWNQIPSVIVRFLLKVLLWAVTVFALYILMLGLIFGMSWYVEQEDRGDTLLVEKIVWLDASQMGIYEKQGIFYMRQLYETSKSKETAENQHSEPAEPCISDEELKAEQERQRISKGAQAICESLGADYEEHFDAKGNLRVVAAETETEISYLRFDRYSENGNCLLYVLSSSEKSRDGSYGGAEEIVNTYAYVLETGAVVPSGKTDWSTPGSAEYQTVTGET